MPSTAQAVESEIVYQLPVGQLHKSPSQPRRRGADKPLDPDFLSSIEKKGVRSPIIVRVRKAGGWEIVFGHRRWEGSKLAKRETIPGIVRDLTDEEVFEDQLIENVHREDMHPLDEADGFKRMMEKSGRSAQQIAEKIGRPLSYVAQRLKLVDLGKEARAALDKDKISLGVAMMIARIPSTLQAEAIKNLWEGMDYQQAKRRIEDHCLLQLSHAPFKLDDATLVEKAGACTVCPKRTGQQRELFPDAGKADMCIDPVCYRGKLDAVWQIRKKEAAAGGTAILEGPAAVKAMSYSGGYKKLDEDTWTGSGHKKVRALFGKDLPPVTLARDQASGTIYELVREADVKKRLPKQPASNYNPRTGHDRRDEVKGKLREQAVAIAIGQAVQKKIGAAEMAILLTDALLDSTWNDEKIVARRELKKGTLIETYRKTLKTPTEIIGLGFELALLALAPDRWGKPSTQWAAAMKLAGVKFEAIEKKLAAEAKAKKAARKPKGKKK